MRTLTGEEIRQLLLMKEAGGLTDEGERLYQRIMSGDLAYDDHREVS